MLAMESLKLFKTFKEEYNKTKIGLQEIERTLENIFEICDGNLYDKETFSHMSIKKSDNFSNIPPLEEKYAVKKIKLEKFSTSEEESCDECRLSPKVLQSAVISKLKKKCRKDVIKQNVNPKIESRNRRMLGMIQGTLRKFRDEEEKRKPQDLKRAQIEQKVDAAAQEERERISLKKKLMADRKAKLQQLKCLEEMMDLTENYEVWECNQKFLRHFVKTKAMPQIYFLPASHTLCSKKQLEKSKMKHLEMVQLRKTRLKEELDKIKESYQLDCLGKEQYGPFMKTSDIENSEQVLSTVTKYHFAVKEEKNDVKKLDFTA